MYNLTCYNLKFSLCSYEIQNLIEVFIFSFLYLHTNYAVWYFLCTFIHPPLRGYHQYLSSCTSIWHRPACVCVNKHVSGCVRAFIQRVRPAEQGTETACSWGEVRMPPWYTSVLLWDSWSEHTQEGPFLQCSPLLCMHSYLIQNAPPAVLRWGLREPDTIQGDG